MMNEKILSDLRNNMKREVGYYCAKWIRSDTVEVIFFDGESCYRPGVNIPYYQSSFSWISDKPIVLEEPPIKMVVGSWYMFNSIHGDTMVGQYDITEYHGIHLRLGKDSWYPVDKVKIIGGPFTTEELSQRK